jgi:hypothetical protein
VNEPDSARLFRAARGLCNEHAWQLITYRGGAVGVAILYQATVDEVLKIMEHAPSKSPNSFGLSRLLKDNTVKADLLSDDLQPTVACMVCHLLSSSEQDYVGVFSRYIGDTPLQEAYKVSDGFCLPHFRLVLEQSYSPEMLRNIISIQKNIWETLRTDLEEFVDKNRNERMHETMGVEGDSWQRAIGQMAGAKGVFGVEPRPVK